MSTPLSIDPSALATPPSRTTPQRIAVVRAALALVWAVALLLAVGDAVPTTRSDVPVAAAALLAAYPLMDAFASIVGATLRGASGRVLHVNAAISTLAAIAIAATAFDSDAGATLAAFGVWATVSGALQFGIAVHRRRTEGRRLSMLISGGLSTLAGLSFLASSGSTDAHLATLPGYMALGAILYLVSARRGRTTPRTTR